MKNGTINLILILFALVGGMLGLQFLNPRMVDQGQYGNRSEVLFWHFWGGADRSVVDDVVRRFNESQGEYFVRAIAMPGNNLQAKLFLAIAGGDPPDIVNQDDPIVGDWGWRGVVQPIDQVCDAEELQEIEKFLYPAADRLGRFDDRLYAVCNGMDVRALFYNRTALQRFGLDPPKTIDELNHIANVITPPDSRDPDFFGYLPDSRRLWAWGQVFGGSFYDFDTQQVTLTDPRIVQATAWMAEFGHWYGSDTINRFRQGDQSLPGKTFPLLPIRDDAMIGRYAMLMDGQWRVRDIEAFVQRRRERNVPCPEFGVCPLPYPAGGRPNAGWANGNFFVIPKGAKNSAGAVAFMKYWIGLTDPAQAAETCAMGGWIPVSPQVTAAAPFQEFLNRRPLFDEFVRLASSENQIPIPGIPGAPMFKREVERATATAMANPEQSAKAILERAQSTIQAKLDAIRKEGN